MALDSNSPGDDRSASSAAEKLAGAGLKLVSERGAGAGATGTAGAAPGPGWAADAATDAKGSGATLGSSPIGRGDRNPGRQVPLWLFAALVVVLLIAYGYQVHHASQLEFEVARLEQSLTRAEARLESHRTHLLEIRGGVHDLSARLESLRALIDQDPTAAASKPPAADSPKPAAP